MLMRRSSDVGFAPEDTQVTAVSPSFWRGSGAFRLHGPVWTGRRGHVRSHRIGAVLRLPVSKTEVNVVTGSFVLG